MIRIGFLIAANLLFSIILFSAETQLAATSARAQALTDAETAVTGVDTDFELQQLILIEQAFAANARVIQTAEQMVLTLLEL